MLLSPSNNWLIALRWTWSARDSMASICLHRSSVSWLLAPVPVRQGQHGAVQAHAGVRTKRGQFARFHRGLPDVVHAHRVGNVQQHVDHLVEFDRQGVDLVAVDRRGERLVQQGDQGRLDLVGAYFVAVDLGHQRRDVFAVQPQAVDQAQCGIGTGDDPV